MKQRFTIIRRAVLATLLVMAGQLLSAQTTIAQWNGYAQESPRANGNFLATEGVSLNKNIAVLTRDAADYAFAVNADGVAASQGWDNATEQEKYWIATFNTTGYEKLTVNSKQRGSNTGARDFKIQYRVGNGAWTDVDGATNIVVANDAYLTGVFADSLPTAMSNQASVSLRWLCTSATSINEGTVAAGGVNRLDVTVSGKAQGGVLNPQIIVNQSELTFTAQNQEESFTVFAENLTEDITVVSSDPTLFLVDPSSLSSDVSDASVKVMFLGSVSASGTITLTSGSVVEIVTVEATVSTFNEEVYTVAEAQLNQGEAGNSDIYWVKGYIIGTSSADGGGAFTPELEPGTFTSYSNILIADSPTETDNAKIIPVQLISQTDVRAALNLLDNPDNYGKYVRIQGTLEPYFNMPGLKNTITYEFIEMPSGVEDIYSTFATLYFSNDVLHIDNLEELAIIHVYDITGKLIVSTEEIEIPLQKGFYIVKIGSHTFKIVNR